MCAHTYIHYDDFVLLIKRCDVIQRTAEHVGKSGGFIFCLVLLHLIKLSMASAFMYAMLILKLLQRGNGICCMTVRDHHL